MTTKTVEKPVEKEVAATTAKAETKAAKPVAKEAAKTTKAETKATSKTEAKTTAKADVAVAEKTEAKTETKTRTQDLFKQIAHEVEQLPKLKVEATLQELNEATDVNLFRMGGLLQRVLENGWFGEYESFGEYVFEMFGFKERKARYLIEIYASLVTNMIPYAKVKGLGWTKLKELAKFLTNENVDEWVKKAEGLSVSELKALIAGERDEDDNKLKPTSDTVSINFKLHPDQTSIVESAINLAKVNVDTEFDNIALEAICAEYVQPNERAAAPAQINEAAVIKFLQSTDVNSAVGFVKKAHPSLQVEE